MKHRLLAIFSATILAAFVITGCSGGSGDEESAPTVPPKVNSDTSKPAANDNPLGDAPKVPE